MLVAWSGHPIFYILQGIQLELQLGRTRFDRPCSLRHVYTPGQITVTTTICKHILYNERSVSRSGIEHRPGPEVINFFHVFKFKTY